ncbi:MAG: LptE family protein [Phycisphaerales bacterium]
MKLAAALAGLLTLVIAGCSSDPQKGYSFATTFPAGVRTVSVPMFTNSTMHTGVEAEVTEALIKELQRSTPLRVTSDTGADSVLVGVIREVDMRRLSLERRSGLVQEVAVQITVDFEWTDRRSGKVLSSRRGLSSSDTFVPARPSGEPIEVAEIGAASRLAKALTSELRANW